MDKILYAFLMVLAMAVITYLIRLIPMILFKKKIKNSFINSLLYYIPYAVLSAMTFPFIIFSSGRVISAVVGTAVALISAFTKRSLVTTALFASASVLIVELIIKFI